MQRYEEILDFWFGRVEETIVPSEHRARVWFAEDPLIDAEIQQRFEGDLSKAIHGQCHEWELDPRGRLALIILLDQFSRHIYRADPQAFAQDAQALKVCTEGMLANTEHSLSLIERVFFYFPLLHSEDLACQEKSVQSYSMLSEMAFVETRVIFDSFLKFANHHYSIINQFGRFPQRNKILHRDSSKAEIAYLKQTEGL